MRGRFVLHPRSSTLHRMHSTGKRCRIQMLTPPPPQFFVVVVGRATHALEPVDVPPPVAAAGSPPVAVAAAAATEEHGFRPQKITQRVIFVGKGARGGRHQRGRRCIRRIWISVMVKGQVCLAPPALS